MKSIVFKSNMPVLTIITRFTTAALLLVALAACNSGGGGGGGSGGTKKATTDLSEPTKLFAIGFNKGIYLSWDKAEGATSYTVYYSKASFSSTSGSGVKSTADMTTDISISITNLSNDTEYFLRVAAISADGQTNLSTQIISATTGLQPPTNLNATGVYKAVKLSWDTVKGATHYNVYYRAKKSFGTTNDEGVDSTTDIKTTSTSITDLSSDVTYYLRVEAVNREKQTKLSTQIVSATATATLQAPILRARGFNKGIDLSWDKTEGATSYTVYYSEDSFDSSTDSGVQSQTGITATKFILTGLTAGTTYYFGVIASNLIANSALSQIVSATAIFQAPILRTTGVNQGVYLSWGSITAAVSYTVYYHTISFENTADVDTTTGKAAESKPDITTTDTSIDNLINGTKYYFRAVTKYQAGVSALSEQVEATADLQAPTKLQATGGNRTIDISWDAVIGADSYAVYYHTDSFSGTTGVLNKTTDTTSISITDLTNGVLYYLRVEAVNADGDKKLSTKIVTATPKLPAPNNPKAAASINMLAAVDLSWDGVAGSVTNYKICISSNTYCNFH